jgi:hypothetical protein
MATIIQPQSRGGADHRFFMIGAIVMALIVVAGFSVQAALGRSTFAAPLLVHVHAVVFMGWVAFYVLQNALVATGSVALHKKLGWIGLGWMLAMVVLGIWITVSMVRRGAVPFFFEPAYFLIMNPVSVLTFAGLTTAAIVMRRRTDWHRRLHFCGMAMLTGPAFGRLLPMPFLIPWAGHAVFAALVILPLVGVIADIRRSGRAHPAWVWGIGTLVFAEILMTVLSYSAPGLVIYQFVTAGSPGAAIDPLVFPPWPVGPLITGGT